MHYHLHYHLSLRLGTITPLPSELIINPGQSVKLGVYMRFPHPGALDLGVLISYRARIGQEVITFGPGDRCVNGLLSFIFLSLYLIFRVGLLHCCCIWIRLICVLPSTLLLCGPLQRVAWTLLYCIIHLILYSISYHIT